MKSLAIVLFALVIGCVSMRAQDHGRLDGNARDVSLVQLIVQPQKYLDMAVRVQGALHWEFEGSYLFLSREHLESYDTASAVRVGLSKKSGAPTNEQLEECSDSLVMVEGIFRMDARHKIYWLEITRVQMRDGRRTNERKEASDPES